MVIFLLAVVLVLSLSLAVFAEETDEIVVNYTSEDGTTIATITFDPANKTAKVNMEMITGLYTAYYETSYSIENDVLVVTDVTDVKADMIPEMIPEFGAFLPTELVVTMSHTFENGVLTVNRAAGDEEPQPTCLFTIDADTLAKLNPAEPAPSEPAPSEPAPTDDPNADPDNPKTGDVITVVVAAMTASAAGVTLLRKKKG